jgi:hypothetical protein
MVLIDDTLHHINTVMGNQFIVFFYFFAVGTQWFYCQVAFENSSRKIVVKYSFEAYFLVKSLF